MRRTEHQARARALQAVYAWDMRDGAVLGTVAERVWDDLAVPAAVRALAKPLVETLERDQVALDAMISAVTTNWRIERLGAIERSVLRLAAAELHLGKTPPKVVLQEATTFAERFGSPASAKFVNGVLDALARRLGRL